MPVPVTPSAFTATATLPRQIDLAWTDGAGTLVMAILRHTADNIGAASVITAVPAGAEAYQDQDVLPETAYFYWLKPYNADGVGTATASVTDTTPAEPDIIQQAIFDAIVAGLATITTANGYRTNIGANVIPWKVAQWELEQMPGVSVADTSDAIEDWKTRGAAAGVRGGVQRNMMQVELAVAVASVTDDAEAEVQMAEVRKAIADIYALIRVNYKWGGNALNTTPQSHTLQIVQDDKIICGGKITVQVEFRTLAFKADDTGQ